MIMPVEITKETRNYFRVFSLFVVGYALFQRFKPSTTNNQL